MDSTLNTISVDDQQRRKRPRMTKSCTLCRARKTRCDQQKPACGSCVKRGKSLLCQYEQHHWNINMPAPPKESLIDGDSNFPATSPAPPQPSARFLSDTNFKNRQPKEQNLVIMNERIKRLEKELMAQKPKDDGTVLNPPYDSLNIDTNNPIRPASDEYKGPKPLIVDKNTQSIDFYGDLFHNSIKFYQGPLSWVTLLHKDVYLNSLIVSSRKTVVFNHVKKDPTSATQRDFLKKWEIENSLMSEMSSKKDKNFMVAVKTALKDLKLVWLLIDKYFSSEFPFVMSFIDREYFENQVASIIGPRGEKNLKLKFTKKHQLSVIGILLMVMKMGSLALYNFGKKPYREITPEDQYIIDNPLYKDLMHLVQRCYTELTTLKEPKLTIFQFYLFREYYGFVAPEECDCIAFTSSGSIGFLLNYGIQCGLNRDPTNIAQGFGSRSKINKNLLRRLWYKVVYLDSHQLMLVGCPPIIDSKFYDTHFPHLDECTDQEDYVMNSWFYDRARLYQNCYPLLMLILNIREKPRITKIEELCVPIAEYVNGLSTLEDILAKPSDTIIQRGKKYEELTFLIDTQGLLLIVYYHLFLFYNETLNKERSMDYLMRILKIITSIYPAVLFLEPDNAQYDLQKHFGCGVLLFPKIEMIFHRFSEVWFSILGRIKFLKTIKPSKPIEILNLVDNIAEVFHDANSLLISRFVKISDKYYHPWVISKMHSFIASNLLQMPKGAFQPKKGKSDSKFFESINMLKHHDTIFELYDINDFSKIFQEVEKISKIEGDSRKKDTSDAWNSQVINDNNRKWLEQMLSERSDQMARSNSLGSSSDISSRQSMTSQQTSTYIPEYGKDPSVMPSNAEVIMNNSETDQTQGTLTDLINGNLDWTDLETLFFSPNSFDAYGL